MLRAIESEAYTANAESLGVIHHSGEVLIHPMSFSIARGELVGLIGASGSGKSVLANALMGTVPEGFSLCGRVVIPKDEVALAAQSGSVLDPLRSVLQLLRRRQKDDQHLGQCREVVDSFGHCMPHELSGGMAKRVLLAQAKVQGRAFLLADEPCCGLDSVASANLYSELRQMADKGAGVLVISHNLRELSEVADRLLVMDDGKLIESLTPDHLKQGLGSPQSRALWQALPENWERQNARVA
ncbi:ATP-binding cassette domain-containing protein [Shewanella submarina]|uniref:ATP-binding cassette domain-containing protein n=1 Tax=Shewanella submarina TaxID=2016376 RepID=A0ABV7GG48_9GAMM|nr:ATP-binding cassette domain-containing protein [Shewanella submarina]MCL1039208.1 ATP-binding cassette domain-containing protein [Shewanella submarina]